MASVLQGIRFKYEDIIIGVDSKVDNWFLMKSPLPIVIILASYLYFVLKLGPQIMANRAPFQLKWTLILYNLYQVLFSVWLFSRAFGFEIMQYIFGFGCRTIQDEKPELYSLMLNSAWWYFFSKVVDLLDTVFFVLRKKHNQISFLHVYHHTITAFFSWIYLKYIPGEQGVLLGALNAFVHIIMYAYYGIAALGPQYQKYLWWKKYMTWIQLGQFVIMLIYLVFISVFNCQKYVKGLNVFFLVNVIIFMYLFADFYRNAYNKKTAKQANQQTKKLA